MIFRGKVALPLELSNSGGDYMEVDAKQKVLIAIYTEYQKDIPEMANITFSSLGLENDVFKVAVEKLDNEGFITDATITHGGNGTIPLMVNIKYCKMTRSGIDYIESKAQLDQTLSGEQKVKGLLEKAGKWGWDQFKDFGARVVSEMLK